MAQALPKLFTFEEFIAWLPENTGKRYELHLKRSGCLVAPKWMYQEIK